MPAIAGARYVHTNLIVRDWEKLATFYEQVSERVFGDRMVLLGAQDKTYRRVLAG